MFSLISEMEVFASIASTIMAIVVSKTLDPILKFIKIV